MGGLTEFALNLCVTILFVVNNNLLTKYGALSEYGSEIPLATYGIMMKLGHIATSLSTGMGQGAQPVIGYCYGHRAYDRVKKTIKFTLIQGLIIGLCVWAVCMIFARNILLLFGSGSELYIQFGTTLIRTYLGLVFLNSIQITTSNILLSIGKAYKGALLTITRNLVLCTLSGLILCPLIGVKGVMYEGLIADGGSAILSFILIFLECKKLNALLAKEECTIE
jgi:Na+-driven multidrug efflux pump